MPAVKPKVLDEQGNPVSIPCYGYAGSCGQPSVPGRQRCPSCLQKARDQMRSYHARKKLGLTGKPGRQHGATKKNGYGMGVTNIPVYLEQDPLIYPFGPMYGPGHRVEPLVLVTEIRRFWGPWADNIDRIHSDPTMDAAHSSPTTKDDG